MKESFQKEKYLKSINDLVKYSLKEAPENFNYKRMTDLLMEISRGMVVALNLYNEDLTKTKTVALSGSLGVISAASNVLGFNIEGKEWDIISSRVNVLKKRDLFYNTSLHEISFGAINKKVSKILEKTFSIGDIYVLKISYRELIGDFIIFIKKDEELKNKTLIKNYIGHIESILTRQRKEIKLAESETRFRSLFDNSPVSIIIHDKDTGEIVDANRQAYKQYALKSVKQLQENSFWMESPYSQKESLAWIRKTDKDGVQQFEWKSSKVNGDIFWEIVTLMPVIIDGTKRILATTIDVTKLKKAEDQLKTSENRYKDLSEQSSTFIWEVNPKGEYIYVSDNIKKITGFSRKELVGKKNVFHLHPKDGRERFKKEIYRIFRKKVKISSLENPILHKNGEIVWVLTSGLPVLDKEGRLLRYRGSDTDISKIKKTEEDLKRKKEEHEALVSNIPGTTYRCLFDKNWTMLYISEDVESLTGYSADDFIKNKVRSYESVIHEAYKDYVDKEIRKAIAHKKPWEVEYAISCKDKSMKWVLEKGRAFFDKSRVKSLDGIIFDISERKKIENELESNKQELEKFKLAVDNASDHIVITDSDGVCLYFNNTAEKITGFSKEEVVGEKVGTKENWGGLMEKKVYDDLWKTIKKDKKPFFGELKNKRKNGVEYYAQASISPILNEKNEVDFFVGIERDVTAEKEVDKAKTEFVSLASHQLRTPLSIINWYAEMLISGDAGEINEDQENYLQEIYKGNQRMVDLVNSLLNVSRLELGTFTITPEKVDIVDLSKNITKDLSITVKEKRQKLKENYEKGLPEISADIKLLRIIIENLLSNAVKYTPEKGKISINIFTAKKEEKVDNKKMNKESMVIRVSDNGYGISKKQQDKIFQKLFRADNILNKDTEGTGLGLYIIKSILDQSGGFVWFNSEEDKGTTFYVTLPLTGMKKKEGLKKLG